MNLREAKKCDELISSLRIPQPIIGQDFYSMINTTDILEYSPRYGKLLIIV
jgi:hypothetical protein